MSANPDDKPSMEIELKTASRETQSSSSGSNEKNADLPLPNTVGSKPSFQLRPPLHHSADSKSSNGYSGDSTPDPSPMLRSSESDPPAASLSKHMSANYTPSWRQHPHSKSGDDTEPTSDHIIDNSNSYAPGIAEAEDCDTPTTEDANSHKNDDMGESFLLEDLERKVGFGTLGGGGQDNLAGLAGFSMSSPTNNTGVGVAPNSTTERGRSASTVAAPMDLLTRMRLGRKLSQESMEYLGFDEMNRQPVRSTLRCCYRNITEGVHYVTPHFYQRLNIYLLVFFMLVISFIAREGDNALALLRLYATTIGLEFACSMADRVVYRIIDIVFESRFDIAYQLHSLNGPLGLIVAIFIMREYWNDIGLNANDVLPSFDNLLTAGAVIVICLAGKNWLTRKQYIHLLESRFTTKVENLNTMIIILSELASTRPPKSVQLQRANALQRRTPSTVNNSGVLNATGNIKNRVKNVFADIVANTTVEEETQEEVITRRELYRKRRSFWQSAARLNATAGRMKVITYNGVVNIHNQSQAKEFGRKLYKHLSKGGKVVITPELIRKLFEERREIVNRDIDEKMEHDNAMSEIVNGQQASAALYEKDDVKQNLWAKAATMFDPFNLGRISEDFCVEAVLNIYKEQRFTAASISDFGELHQSLRIGIDIVYWIVMIFVLQSTLGFDLASYLLPFITLLLSFSFAISSLVGNIFLAFAFVFFMAPFDVGHKVQIGLVSSSIPPPVGYVKSISLLYTVINSGKNETIKIPNSALWSEKVYNFTETTGATHEFIVSFNLYGAGHADYEKIKLFFTRLKHFTLRESKEWKSFFLSATAMDTPNNTMEYRVYCTHREGWGMSQAVGAAKIEYYAAIKRLREDLGLVYYKANMPVSVAYVSNTSNSSGGSGISVPTSPIDREGIRHRSNAVHTVVDSSPSTPVVPNIAHVEGTATTVIPGSALNSGSVRNRSASSVGAVHMDPSGTTSSGVHVSVPMHTQPPLAVVPSAGGNNSVGSSATSGTSNTTNNTTGTSGGGVNGGTTRNRSHTSSVGYQGTPKS